MTACLCARGWTWVGEGGADAWRGRGGSDTVERALGKQRRRACVIVIIVVVVFVVVAVVVFVNGAGGLLGGDGRARVMRRRSIIGRGLGGSIEGIKQGGSAGAAEDGVQARLGAQEVVPPARGPGVLLGGHVGSPLPRLCALEAVDMASSLSVALGVRRRVALGAGQGARAWFGRSLLEGRCADAARDMSSLSPCGEPWQPWSAERPHSEGRLGWRRPASSGCRDALKPSMEAARRQWMQSVMALRWNRACRRAA